MAAKMRCTNPKDPAFPNYGGRGIEFRFASVGEAVQYIVENFGAPTSPLQMLDRIDNNGHYERGNIRYVKPVLSVANRRVSVTPLWDEQQWPYARTTVFRYLKQGLSREQILEKAYEAVILKRRNWRGIQEKLKSLT